MPDALAKPAAGGDTAAVCAAFKPQGDALAAAAGTLATYFQAMQQLASFDNSAVTGNAEGASANFATAANLSASQIDSISKLSGLVTRAFTDRYQQRHLFEYLRAADPHVASLTGGLEDVLRKDYPGLLAEERRNLNIRYQRVASPGSPALVLLLNRAYKDDIDELERRAKVALAYADALSQIRQAHVQLANEAGHLGARQLSLALRPYSAKLEALAPELVKTF